MREELLQKIAQRGDRYGGQGGLLDLLNWCGKQGVTQVTKDEALLFWQNPAAPYPPQSDDVPAAASQG